MFEALTHIPNCDFHVIYSADYIPERVNTRLQQAIGNRAVGMRGEKRIGPNEFTGYANTSVRVVYQPGILKAISKTNPDVLVADGFFQWTMFSLIYKLLHKCPVVICYERTAHTERKAQWFRTVYRKFVVRLIDAMNCNGRLSLEYIKLLGLDGSRINTGHQVADTENLSNLYSAVGNEDRINLRGKWGNPDLVFLVVGRLIKLKGIKELMRGWSLLVKNVPGNWALVLIGDGPEEDNLKQEAHSLGLDSIVFQGAIDYNDIAKYYAAAEVLVMPSLEDNWSLVVPEAMTCEKPIVCSKYNGCYPELVKEGENGWVYDPLSEQGTFQALKTCVENREKLRDMGKKSREIAALHTPAHAAESILDACKIALQRK